MAKQHDHEKQKRQWSACSQSTNSSFLSSILEVHTHITDLKCVLPVMQDVTGPYQPREVRMKSMPNFCVLPSPSTAERRITT